MDILIVETKKKELKLLKECVNTAYPGSTLYLFSDTEKALSFANAQPVDLCFTEIVTGKVSGFAITKAVRDLNSGARVVFIADCKDYALDAWKLHINDYLLKPITKESVMHTVTNY